MIGGFGVKIGVFGAKFGVKIWPPRPEMCSGANIGASGVKIGCGEWDAKLDPATLSYQTAGLCKQTWTCIRTDQPITNS